MTRPRPGTTALLFSCNSIPSLSQDTLGSGLPVALQSSMTLLLTTVPIVLGPDPPTNSGSPRNYSAQTVGKAHVPPVIVVRSKTRQNSIITSHNKTVLHYFPGEAVCEKSLSKISICRETEREREGGMNRKKKSFYQSFHIYYIGVTDRNKENMKRESK